MLDLVTAFWTVVAISLPIFTLFLIFKFKQEPNNQDPYKIRQCPNPNCIRCTRYAEVNESAQRRLPWILWSILEQYPDSQEADLKRDLRLIEKAVQQGPDVLARRRQSSVSPTLGQYPTVLLVPGLVTQPLVTHLHTDAACRTLLQGGDDLRKEILQEYIDSHSPVCPDKGTQIAPQWLENDVSNSGIDGGWRVLHLLNQGIWNTNNMKACPKTTKLVQSLKDLLEGSIFGNAYISVLRPGTTIEPHCGPSNVRHRLHFALQTPTDEADEAHMKQHIHPVLTVAGVKQTWKAGSCFVFDDSLTHSVVYIGNKAETTTKSPSQARVVLIADLWHPDLTEEQRAAIIQLYPSLAR